MRLLDYTASRSNLLKGYLILSLNSIDEQYSNLFTGCGAIFIAAHDVSQDEVWATIKIVPQIDKQYFCIFSDEFCKHNTSVIATEYSNLGVRYLSATQLATAIFSNAKPVLTGDPPSYKTASSQRFNTQASQSQAVSGKAKSVQKKILISDASSKPSLPAPHTIKEELGGGATAKLSSKDSLTLSFTSLTSPLPAMKIEAKVEIKEVSLDTTDPNVTARAAHNVDDEVDLGSEQSLPVEANDVSSSKIRTDSKLSSAVSGLVKDPDQPINVKATSSGNNSSNSSSSSSSSSSGNKGINVPGGRDLYGDDSDLVNASNTAPSHKRRRAGSFSADENDRQRTKVGGLEDCAMGTKYKECDIPDGNCTVDNSDMIEDDLSADADWMTAVQGKDRADLLKFKNKSFKSEFDNSIVCDNDSRSSITRTEADSLVRMLIIKNKANLDRVLNQNFNGAGQNPRDVRKFRKNSIRVADSDIIMSARFMEAVLPKESEREIQLRLNADADESREEFAEQMFSDRCTTRHSVLITYECVLISLSYDTYIKCAFFEPSRRTEKIIILILLYAWPSNFMN